MTAAVADRWFAHGHLATDLPNAREYCLVFRYERQGLPDLQAAPIVADEVFQLLAVARSRHINVVGVQLT
jgi:FAD/FMN-containing dehydrogenase